MKFRFPNISSKTIWISVSVLAVGLGYLTRDGWMPRLQSWVPESIALFKKTEQNKSEEANVHKHDEVVSLKLSPQARRNIGLTDDKIRPLNLGTFTRFITVPALVVEDRSKSRTRVTAPMTGVLTGVYVVKGEAVYRPKKASQNNLKTESTLLFKLRLSHEDVVKSQTTFLQAVEKLRVVEQDIVRLKKLTAGLAPAKLRDRLYEKQILDADINSLGEGLQLHGLSKNQIESIKTNRKLIREILVRLPAVNPDGSLAHPTTPLQLVPTRKGLQLQPIQGDPDPSGSKTSSSQPLIVEEMNVYKGQLVQAGETLCELTDYSKLYLEGQAFERDSSVIEKARENKWAVTALLENNNRDLEPIQGLQIDYLDNHVDLTSRALRFYARLQNKVTGSVNNGRQQRVTWRFKPGQRMQLRVPVEKWTKRFVLPVDAIAKEGAEYYVFRQNGDSFVRKPVHVEYQDQFYVIIANDGSVFPGTNIAFAGAHQIQMAIKNAAGGGTDPHAGHNH